MAPTPSQGPASARAAADPLHPVRLLLVNPRFPESFWSFRWAIEEILPRKRAINPPLGLATLAALCPPHWEVTIVDENVESIPLAPQADIVGICGMGVQHPRQRELLEYYRARGYFVVAGGSFASLCPERFESIADTVICGEAEYIWPRFCRDFAAGTAAPLYRETGTVALTDSPTPRFDLLKLEAYTTVTLQFSRGCPFMCEFCDIIVMFGRKPRWKSNDQVGRELDALRLRGVRNVFFVDDNLIGNKKAAKALLAFLVDYQERHDYRFTFGTEASLNLASDAELLRLFRAANFAWVFIGIESADTESLKEARKGQNLQEDTLVAVRRIYAHGIDVLAGFIVGFDNDSPATFDVQRRLIVDSGISAAMVGLLTALPRTPLHERLAREGRLIVDADDTNNTRLGTNVIPKRMSYDAMIDGYRALYQRLTSDRGIADRVRNKMRYLRDPVYHGEYSARERVGIVLRLVTRGVLRGGPARAWHFLRSVPWRSPAKMPLAVVDWIAGLAMRDYVRRRFGAALDARRSTLASRAERLRRALRVHVDRGAALVSFDAAAAALPRITVSIRGALDRAFFVRLTRHVDRLLAKTPSSLTLRIDALGAADVFRLQRLLRRLAPHGDRISIVLHERVRSLVRVDSSIFHLVLPGSGTAAASA
ncbi:MAG TPA: radical SAM protein [Casimicrobiaceae bacterium]